MENSLKMIGASGAEAYRLNQLTSTERVRELRQGLEAYTNEVLADRPVSILYHYWIDTSGNFFTSPPEGNGLFRNIYNIDHQFDPQERLNLPREGFKEVRRLVVNNPQSVVLWYSPPGPASFDTNNDNPYSDIHYDYGQLYVHYFDGEKVNAVAVKVSNPRVLSQWLPNLQQPQTESQDEIKESLLTPLIFQGSIDDFIQQSPQSNEILYVDKKNVSHTLATVISDIERTLKGNKTNQSLDFDKTLASLSEYELTEQKILTIYLETIQRYQQTTGNMVINLSGSCGGTEITSLNIDYILSQLSQTRGLPSISELLNPVGSAARMLGSKDYRNDPNLCRCGASGKPHFHCPGSQKDKPCNHPIDVGDGTTKCPVCGKGKIC